MGNFPKKKAIEIKQRYQRLFNLIEFTAVLLALILPVILLSSQIEKIKITQEASPDCDLEKWLQSITMLFGHF